VPEPIIRQVFSAVKYTKLQVSFPIELQCYQSVVAFCFIVRVEMQILCFLATIFLLPPLFTNVQIMFAAIQIVLELLNNFQIYFRICITKKMPKSMKNVVFGVWTDRIRRGMGKKRDDPIRNWRQRRAMMEKT